MKNPDVPPYGPAVLQEKPPFRVSLLRQDLYQLLHQRGGHLTHHP